MPALHHLPEVAPAPRHAQHAKHAEHAQRVQRATRHVRTGRHGRRRAFAFAAVVVSVTAFAVGPATAQEAAPVVAPVPTTVPIQVVGPVDGAEPVDTFQAMLDEAKRAARVERAIAHKRAVVEAAHERARRLAAKVRASRAGLRSEVVRPVSGGYHLTARFGDSSSHWGSGHHTGLDFACSVGTPVHAVADGVVISAGYSGAYGNRIEIRHADGTVTTYNHLSRIEVHGGAVKAGRVIGLVGTTGNTTGAHLHFEVEQGGSYVDPEHWLAARYVAF